METILERADDRRAARPVRLLRRAATARPARSSPRPEIARALGKKDLVTIKALQLSISSGVESQIDHWDGSHVRNTRNAADARLCGGRHHRPARRRSRLIEVHDCFSITELVTMEDLFISEDGRAVHDVLDGFYDRDGGCPARSTAA